MNAIDNGANDSIRDITAILVRRKRQILVTFVVAVAAVTAGTLLMPKQYESHMKILVKNERADMVVTADSNTGTGYQGAVSEEQINTEIELLNSESLLRQVVEKCGLEKLEKSAGYAAAERRPIAIERAVLRLQKNLGIAAVRKANVIQVDYISKDPHLAASVLRQVSDSYLEAHLRLHSTPGTYAFFASQAAHYREELSDAEARLAAFRQQDNIVMLEQQKDVMLRKAADSESALLQAEAAVGEYSDRIADTQHQLAASSARVVTQSRTGPNQFSVDHLSAMLADLRNRRTELLAKFRSNDRLVLEVDKEMADTQAALDKATTASALEESTDVNPVRQTLEIDMAKEQAELAGLQARRQALAAQTRNYHSQLMTLGNATAQFDDLTRARKEAEDNYLLYARKTEEARIAESLDRQKIANVAIAETPVEPHLPSKPNVPLNLSLGVLLAGFLSVGVAFSAEYLQPPPQRRMLLPPAGGTVEFETQYWLESVEQPAELEAITGLPVLATVHRT
jgi:uncharacterized protein involved in exopolysaccharide biosynthesis